MNYDRHSSRWWFLSGIQVGIIYGFVACMFIVWLVTK